MLVLRPRIRNNINQYIPEGKENEVMSVETVAHLFGCDLSVVCDEKKLARILKVGLEKIGADIVSVSGHYYGPGASSMALIGENRPFEVSAHLEQSHAAIHTWPENNGFCRLILDTCDPKMDGFLFVRYVAKEVGAKSGMVERSLGCMGKIKHDAVINF